MGAGVSGRSDGSCARGLGRWIVRGEFESIFPRHAANTCQMGLCWFMKAACYDIPMSTSSYSPPQDVDRIEDEIATLCGHINAATYRLLCCIRAFDEKEAWAEQGALSMAHWLSWRVGIGLRAGREQVRVARALVELPQISASFELGEISYSKVRAITRIAKADTEEQLLEIAHGSTAAQIEKLVRRFRGATRGEMLAVAKDQLAGRYVRTYYDDDGMLVIEARLPAERGAMVEAALRAAREEAAGSAEHLPYDQAQADALARVAERSLAGGDGDESKPAPDRHQVVVHVQASDLAAAGVNIDDDTGAEPRNIGTGPVLNNGEGIAHETARRIACDASVVTLVEDTDGAALNIGTKSRAIPTGMRRAMDARDDGCVFPGCTNKHVDGHHVRHWADGGETSLENIVSVCRRHHTQIHEGGFGIRRENGRFIVTDPRGRDVPAVGERCSGLANTVAELMASSDALGLCIHAQTAFPQWQGETMDYDLAVAALM